MVLCSSQFQMRLLLFLTGIPLVLAKCPLNSVFYPDSNSCYFVSQLNLPYNAAESVCKLLGGHLASIHSDQQNEFLQGLIGVQTWMSFYIGVNGNDNIWQNSDGSVFNYSKFEDNIPSFGFAYIQPLNTTWSVTKYPIVLHFICEVRSQFYQDGVHQNCSCRSATPMVLTHPPSLLSPNDTETGLVYGVVTNAWYAGSQYVSTWASYMEGICANAGAHLPSVWNAYENKQLESILNIFQIDRGVIGYVSDTNEVWAWTDGSNNTYTNWQKGEPQFMFPGTHWALMDAVSGWKSVDTGGNMKFICEFRQSNRNQMC